MSNMGSGNRLMSIHSMLGGMTSSPLGNSETSPSKMMPRDDSRPSSVPVPHEQNRISPHQQGRVSQSPAFRAHSQPPLPGSHDPPRFFAPQQNHEHVYNHGPPAYQNQHHQGPPAPPQTHAHQQQRSASGNGAHLQHPQPGHFHVNNSHITNHANYNSPSLHERERERDREREEERRRRERERMANEVVKPQVTHFDIASRPGSRAHSRAASHHHHHVHHNHPTFKRPKITISSQKTFDEAKLYPEKKLGRWTYSPSERLPFKLSINATITVHIPRRYLFVENNDGLKRRKVWGTEIYTDDSDLVAVLTHSTSSIPAEGDVEMSIRVMPRLIRYISSMSNDLRSRGWSTKHDGLSYYVEKVSSVSWKRESLGKGFLKRSLQEMQYLMAENENSRVILTSWSPQKFCKTSTSDGSAGQTEPSQETVGQDPVGQHDLDGEPNNAPRPIVEPLPTTELFDRRESTEEVEGDETIELSMEEPVQDVETTSSFIEPQGPLILNQPEVLPTELSIDVAAAVNIDGASDGQDAALKTAFPREGMDNVLMTATKEENQNNSAALIEPDATTGSNVAGEVEGGILSEVDMKNVSDEATTTRPSDSRTDVDVEIKIE